MSKVWFITGTSKGALWVTQTALPILREQRSGHVIQVSSIGGISAQR